MAAHEVLVPLYCCEILLKASRYIANGMADLRKRLKYLVDCICEVCVAGVALAPGHAFAAETKDTNQFGVSYDDARVMADMLSAAFDLGYISYDVPAESTSAPAYSPSRPFKHM